MTALVTAPERPAAPGQRRTRILRAVRTGPVHVADLARDLGVSEMTVRRDLRLLARDGKVERVHGGALHTTNERAFDEVAVDRLAAKDAIGAAAAALVEDGQTVMLDIGTTTLQVARHLRGRRVTVITTNLAVYEELLDDDAIEIVLAGGLVRRNYRSFVGVLAEDSLRQLRADVAFLGTSAIDARLDLWDTTMIEVPIKRAMLSSAERTVLVADAAKFSMTGVVRVCGLPELDQLITDAATPATRRTDIEDAGVEVTIA